MTNCLKNIPAYNQPCEKKLVFPSVRIPASFQWIMRVPFCLAVFLATAGAPCFRAQENPSAMPSVSYTELLEHVRHGRVVANRRVSAKVLERVLKAVQSDPKARPSAELWLSHCDVQGDLNIGSISEGVSMNTLRSAGIPDFLVRRLEERGIKEVRLVNIPITLLENHFSSILTLSRGHGSRRLRFGGRINSEAVLYTEPVFISGSEDLELVADFGVFQSPFHLSGAHLRRAHFQSAVFAASSYFSNGTVFEGWADFHKALWINGVDLDRATFFGEADFTRAVFEGPAYFSSITAQRMAVKKPTLGSPEEGDEGAAGHLIFEGVRFNGRAYFNGSRLDEVDFSRPSHSYLGSEREVLLGRGDASVVFGDRVIFRGAELNVANFSNAEFRAYADFTGTRFSRIANFEDTTFETEADFMDAQFGGEVFLDGVRFQKVARLEWPQLEHALKSDRSATYATLEQNFNQLGDVGGKNQAYFLKEFYRLAQLRGLKALENQASRYFWGYGVRPLRVLLWMFAAYAVFFGLHLRYFWKLIGHLAFSAGQRLRALLRGRWQPTCGGAQAPSDWKSAGSEVKHVLAASARATFSLNPKHSRLRGPLYQAQFLVMKPLLLLFAYSLANVSPVLQVFTRALHF